MIDLWFKGLILGFSIAAPVGPIGLLCIRRTLAEGRRVGFISGLGAASADAVYGSIAAFGLATALSWLISWQTVLHWLGGAFILWLGLRFIISPSVQKEANDFSKPSNKIGVFISTFILTLSNPMTIFTFMAIFVGAGFTYSGSSMAGDICLVIGVFCGSVLWWFLLSTLVSWFGKYLKNQWLVWINRAAGVGLVVFGLFTILN
jgi:threonine/homoserine/homoserine lactone efflux protein